MGDYGKKEDRTEGMTGAEVIGGDECGLFKDGHEHLSQLFEVK